MCIDIFRDPAKALAKAKSSKSTNKTWLALLEASILLALAAALTVGRAGSFSQAAVQVGVMSAVSVFITVLIISVILGYILKIIVTTLGGSGKYFEGLTVVSYAILPISAGLFAAAVFALAQPGIAISALATAVGFAYGLSILYRGIKELFRTDMVTALVAVSILIIVLFAAASVTMGFAALTKLSTVLPVR
jgi:hypothetical protein